MDADPLLPSSITRRTAPALNLQTVSGDTGRAGARHRGAGFTEASINENRYAGFAPALSHFRDLSQTVQWH
jgi:hypothetical protein